MAIRSAIAATADKNLVSSRGHKIDSIPDVPLVVTEELESLQTTKKVYDVVNSLGLGEDLSRAVQGRGVRAGKGKMRGRKMKTPKSFLIVVGQDMGIGRAARNLVGVDVAEVHGLNAELLAPGTHPGRLVLWTTSAIERLEKEALFM